MFRFRRNVKFKVPKYFYIVSLSLFLFLGVGYSIITSTLGINGNIIAAKNNWNIIFDNIEFQEETIPGNVEVTINNHTSMEINANLVNPKDRYVFTFDIHNSGTLDTILNKLQVTELTEEQKEYLNYEVKYLDKTDIEQKDIIKAQKSRKVKVIIEYIDRRINDYYPSIDTSVSLNINMNFTQVKEEKVEVTLIKDDEEKVLKTNLIEQTLSLKDENITEEYKVISCNNNAKAITDESGIINITNIKENATCKLEKSLKEAIENSGLEKSYITYINDELNEIPSMIIVDENANITIDLNGKSNYSKSAVDGNTYTNPYINNKGNLKIIDTKGTGSLKTDYKLIINNMRANLIINGGTYIRDLENTDNTGVVVGGGGNITIKNASLSAGVTYTIYLNVDNSILNIENSIITSTRSGTITNLSANNEINIRNSVIEATNDSSAIYDFTSNGKASGNVYICSSEIKASASQSINTGYTRIFYSNDTIINNHTLNPKLHIESDIACKK